MLLNRRALIQGLAATATAALALAVFSIGPVVADDGRKRLVITDSNGDQGLLAPYVHRRNGPGYLYTSYVFDALLGQDAAGNAVPALARSWRLSEDGLTYDIELDSKARWHDGKPVTSADVAFTFSYMAEHPYVFGSVAGVRAVEIASDDRMRVILHAPDASFLFNALLALPILPKHIYENQLAPERFADLRAATGSGPYKLVSYDKAQGRYLLERNPDYYLGTPKFDQVAIVKMAPDAAIQAMRTGEVNIIADLPFDRVEQARAAGLSVLTATSNHPARLVFNYRGMFASRDLRHALAYMLDRQALVDIVYHGAAVVAEMGYFQAGSPWRSDQNDPQYIHNPETARDLFQKQGWSRDASGRWRANGEPVEFRLLADKRLSRLATAVADQMEAFGIAVDVRVLETAAVQDSLRSGSYDLALSSSSTLGDPGGIANRVLGSSWNSDRYPDNSGEKKALLDAQVRTTNHHDRLQYLHRFQTLYAEELPAYMLANPLWATAHDERVSPRYLPNGIAIGIPMALPKSILMQ